MELNRILDRIDAEQTNALNRLLEFLRIRSISTDPTHASDCQMAAEWLAEDLRSIGFKADVRPTSGHPMVVAHGPSNGKRYLFYGHYDVQPVDPIELWERDPFDPIVENQGREAVIRGRGASDDKGQLMTFVEACRAWKDETGELPMNISMLFEGEEESGSPSLVPFLKRNAEELSADLALICDTGLFDNRTPAIITMLRGLLGEEITVTGPDKDLHSGQFGGIAANPLRILSRVLADLHDDSGRVAIPGFYDGVEDVPDDIVLQWNSLGFSATDFLGKVGLSVPAGESNHTPLEMIWSRPTCEVNGIVGGYTGPGFKTVIPSRASAKVSFRLVGSQDPYKLRRSFRDFVRWRIPADCSVEFTEHGAGSASMFSTDHPLFGRARKAITPEWPNRAVYTGEGGSIPIAGHFSNILGMDSFLLGFGKVDDQIHSPNEKYDVDSFQRGARSWARIINELQSAHTPPGTDDEAGDSPA